MLFGFDKSTQRFQKFFSVAHVRLLSAWYGSKKYLCTSDLSFRSDNESFHKIFFIIDWKKNFKV